MKTLLIFFLSLISLNGKSQVVSKTIINNIATKYSAFHVLIVIPVVDHNEYKEAVVSNTTLKAYYLGKVNKIKCKNFNAFLHKVLSRKLIIDNADSHLLKTNMIVNKTAPIFKLYKLHGINAVINHYLEGTSRQLSERKGLTQNDRNGLIQLMFEHNYYAVFSDHAGVINFYTDPL